MPVPASMTPAGTSTCRESTGTSRPSRTTARTNHGSATLGAATAPRSDSGTMDLPRGTALAARRPVTAINRPEGDRLPETDTVVSLAPTATVVHPQQTAAAQRPRRPSPARRPVVLATRRTRPQCAAPGPAAGVMRDRSRPASSRRQGRVYSPLPTCGAHLPPAPAGPLTPGFNRAQRRPGPASFRPGRLRRAGPPPAFPARPSLTGTGLAGTSLAHGGEAVPAPAPFRLQPAGAGPLVPARCRPVLRYPALRSPLNGGLRRSRSGNQRQSSDPAGSWRLAHSVPG
jgi:hypothetical protein